MFFNFTKKEESSEEKIQATSLMCGALIDQIKQLHSWKESQVIKEKRWSVEGDILSSLAMDMAHPHISDEEKQDIKNQMRMLEMRITSNIENNQQIIHYNQEINRKIQILERQIASGLGLESLTPVQRNESLNRFFSLHGLKRE